MCDDAEARRALTVLLVTIEPGATVVRDCRCSRDAAREGRVFVGSVMTGEDTCGETYRKTSDGRHVVLANEKAFLVRPSHRARRVQINSAQTTKYSSRPALTPSKLFSFLLLPRSPPLPPNTTQTRQRCFWLGNKACAERKLGGSSNFGNGVNKAAITLTRAYEIG